MPLQRVVIIGAGAAGLSVAKQLELMGQYEVVHLEAQNYVGGRVKSHTFSGLALDSGARFLHHKSLTLHSEAKGRNYLAKPGKSAIILKGRYLPAWRFALFHILPSIRKSKRLISSFYQNRDPQKSIEDLIVAQGMNEASVNFFRQTLGSSLGCDVRRAGAMQLRDSFRAAGVRVDQDLINQALNRPLAELLKELYAEQASKVRLEHVVSELDYRGGDIKVQTTKGALFTADKVVVTVPLAILKRDSIHFNPAIPDQQQRAIDRLGVGLGGLFFLHFKQCFWKKGLAQLINVDSRCHFWMPDPVLPIIIAFYLFDEDESFHGDQYLQQVLRTLSSVFECDARALLDDYYHENWSENQMIGGLYSYDAMGSEGARSALQNPIDHRIFFAGEATIEGHFATVDGAIASGERAAKQLGACSEAL